MKYAGAAPLIALPGFNREQEACVLSNDGSNTADLFKPEPSEFAPTHNALQKALQELTEVNHQTHICLTTPGALMGSILVFAAYGAYELEEDIHNKTLEDIVNKELPPIMNRVPGRIKNTLQRLEKQYNESFLSKRTTLWYDVERVVFELDRDVLLHKDVLCFAFHYGISYYHDKWKSIAWQISNPLTSHEITHAVV